MDISIVILNWNGAALLRECLPSVTAAAAAYSAGGCDVIVVDNASSDDSRPYVGSFPGMRCLALAENMGFARAMNRGIREARNRLVVCLNNDVTVEKDFLAPLARAMEKNVFCCGAKMLFPDRKRLYFGRASGSFPAGFFIRRISDSRVPALSLYGCAGACLLDRDKFLSLGGFDEDLDVYWEDLDLCYRAWKQGWSTVYEPASVVYHKARATNGVKLGNAGIERLSGRNYGFFLIKNIHDPRFAFTQLLTLPLLMISACICGKYNFALGIVAAIRGYRLFVMKRGRLKQDSVLNDRQVLRLSSVTRGVA